MKNITTITRILLLAFILGLAAAPDPVLAQPVEVPSDMPDVFRNTEAENRLGELFLSVRGLAVVLIIVWIVIGGLAIVIMGKTQMAMNVIIGTFFIFVAIYIVSMLGGALVE